jgi:hypothetical protein
LGSSRCRSCGMDASSICEGRGPRRHPWRIRMGVQMTSSQHGGVGRSGVRAAFYGVRRGRSTRPRPGWPSPPEHPPPPSSGAAANVGRQRRKRGDREKREDMWARHHVSSMSAKPHNKNAEWPNMNGIESWMVKEFWFCSSMAKPKLRA